MRRNTLRPGTARHHRRPTSASAFATKAAVLVSSILVSSPAMIAPVSARFDTHESSRSSVYQYAFGNVAAGKQRSTSDTEFSDSYLPSSSSTTPSMDSIDDHLPPSSSTPSHRLHPRQYDDESALFSERSSLSHNHIDDSFDRSPVASPTQSSSPNSHRYSLPSTYPSSIASSWSRPERSVWFQQKAIIITSIFLAIFIVLFIGAAVFLRERKFDDELAGLDDEEALERIEERMTMGRFSDPPEKDSGGKKRRFRLRKGKKEESMAETEPSTGSSSAVKRRKHLVSRWTRGRDSGDTSARSVSDTASVRSGRTARRVGLGDPRAQQESVEVVQDESGEVNPEIAPTSTEDRPRSPPPPHPNSTGTAVDPNLPSPHPSPHRILLDDSDFRAADIAEVQHMPPAYIPASSSTSAANPAPSLAAALARGDEKHGIPPPEERDPDLSPEVIHAVLSRAPSSSEEEASGVVAAHIATDDKALLSALREGASMPNAAPSAPAYADSGTSSSTVQVSTPTAPALEVDNDGFELPADVGEKGKGKAKAPSPSLLPAPPSAVETAFSPFDQPYRSPHPSTPVPKEGPGRKSEKQKEAEEEQLAGLVASRPVPRYERLNSGISVVEGASAPPLEEEVGPEEGEGNLPAYEQRRRSSAALANSGAATASAPTAPPPEDATAPSAPPGEEAAAPSAPSADN